MSWSQSQPKEKQRRQQLTPTTMVITTNHHQYHRSLVITFVRRRQNDARKTAARLKSYHKTISLAFSAAKRANHPETSTNLINTLTFCTHTHTHTLLWVSEWAMIVASSGPMILTLCPSRCESHEKSREARKWAERAVSFEQTYEGVIQVINIVFIDVWWWFFAALSRFSLWFSFFSVAYFCVLLEGC